jgi:hypothetical protein
MRIECGLDSRSRAGVWQNDRADVRAVRTIQGVKNEVRIRFGCGLDSSADYIREYTVYHINVAEGTELQSAVL